MSEEKSLEELSIIIAGESFHPDKTNFAPNTRLEAKVSDNEFRSYGGIYIFKTPLSQYLPDFEEIPKRNGEIIDLGVMPSLIHNNVQNAELDLEPETLYDFWHIHHGLRLDNARITTGKAPIPYRETLNEVQLLILMLSRFKPQDVLGVKGTIVYDPVNLRNRRQYLYYGIQVGNVVATINTNSRLALLLSYRTGDIDADFLNSNNLGFQVIENEISRLKQLQKDK